MNASFLAGTEAERRLLPGGTLRGPTPYVIAIMTFAMMIVAAAGLALANAAGVVAGAVEHRYVLQLPDGGVAKVEAALRASRSTPGAQMIRLEQGTMVDRTGALRNPPAPDWPIGAA